LPFGSKKISSGRVKDGSTCYLLWVKKKLGSGQGPSLEMRLTGYIWTCNKSWTSLIKCLKWMFLKDQKQAEIFSILWWMKTFVERLTFPYFFWFNQQIRFRITYAGIFKFNPHVERSHSHRYKIFLSQC